MNESLNNLLQIAVFFILFFISVCIVGLIFGLNDWLSDRRYKKHIEYKKQFNKCRNCQGLYSGEQIKNYCDNCRIDKIL